MLSELVQFDFVFGSTQNLHWKLKQLTPSFGSTLAVRLKIHFFKNKTFLFFKIESWNFQNLFEIEFCETSQNFNSFSLFRQLLFSFFFYRLSDWDEIVGGFTKFFFKQMLKVSAFYLTKQKSFIPKKIHAIFFCS